MKVPRVCIAVALASVSSFVGPPLFGHTSFIDIGSLGPFGSSFLWAVNNRNEAVGWSELSGRDTEHGILWKDGQLVDLGVLPGYPVSRALAINERGQIVGFGLEFSLFHSKAILWEDGQPIDISPPDATSCGATAINNRGDIAGNCWSAVVWRGGVMTPLDMPPGSRDSYAAAINDAGVVVGAIETASGALLPARWTDGVPTLLGLPSGAIGGFAAAVNARGTAAGYVQTPIGYEPVIWEAVAPIPLAGAWGLYSGDAFGINDRGEVVGRLFGDSPGGGGGFVWRDGRFLLLDPSGLASDINERGVVVGRYHFDPNISEQHGILWLKPATRIVPPVPGAVVRP